MPERETEYAQICQEQQCHGELVSNLTGASHAHDLLFDDVERMLEAARPRLLGFARTHGVMPDAADDVVQETLLEAWRGLEHLSAPERFEAWLYGICRNMCRRWAEAHYQQRQQQTYGLLLGAANASEHGLVEDLVDPLAPDPAEVLSQQDLAILLDRALGYLPDKARSALEYYYLADLPRREIASRLGLTINALEVRLHRARLQLRQVFNVQLRTDVKELGLALDEEMNSGWRETRIWCMFCARYHLQGRFETFSDGRVNLRLRCPSCSHRMGSPEQDGGLTYSGGMLELRNLHAFRPAFNRVAHAARDYWQEVSQRGRCLHCGTPLEAHLLGPEERIPPLPYWPGLLWVTSCPDCEGIFSTYAGWTAWFHPRVQDFMKEHPRWMCEPEVLVEYAGQPAVRARFVDLTSTAQLVVLIQVQTMEVLATFRE